MVATRTLRSLLGLLPSLLAWPLSASLAGCAQSVGDIDRTQPDLIAKKHFEGKWFVRETVVDVPATSPAAFVGDMGGLEVVVWDVQQDWLVGYRAYELVAGSDARALTDRARPGDTLAAPEWSTGTEPAPYRGNPIVAYRIESHVDVQRSYNPRTGEQSNLLIEDSSDRPWDERDYMRVDWSRNEVDSFAVEARPFWPMFGAESTMASFVPEREGGESAFRMALGEDGLANYLDFTVRRTVVPSVMGCAALLFDSEIGDCTGEEVETRTSLLKLDPEREAEYVPLPYDDYRQGEFGLFRVVRPTYDRRLGNTETGIVRLAERHDLWQESRDASGAPLPLSARTLRPIVYALSEHYPEEMVPAAEAMAEEINQALERVAATGRGQSVSALREDLLADTGSSCLFCLDFNRDRHARNGDLRYNFLYWVHDRQAVSPLGFGPSSANPETGRIVSASAYVYGAEVDRYAEYAKQLVELMNGDAREGDFIDGSYFVRARLGGLRQTSGFASSSSSDVSLAVGGDASGVGGAEPDALLAAPWMDSLPGDAWAEHLLDPDALARLDELSGRGLAAFVASDPGMDAERLRRAVGTRIESQMIPEEWLDRQSPVRPSFLERRDGAQAARLAAVDREAAGALSSDPLALPNFFGADALVDEQRLLRFASERNLWLARFSDPSIVGLADRMRREGLSGDALYEALRESILRAVGLHELGHTLGLRHNFGGSADPLNYPDDYWDLRVKSLEPVRPYVEARRPSASAMLRSNCAITSPLVTTEGETLAETGTAEPCAEQQRQGMAELAYSSIMDYEGRFNGHLHGFGHYDVAALAAAYADLVEVFDAPALEGMSEASRRFGIDVRAAVADANQRYNPSTYQGLGPALVRQGGDAQFLSHYQNLPGLFSGRDNIARRRFIPRAEYVELQRHESELPPAERALSPVKVPYLGCYDEYVDAVETCHRWDQGADYFEIVSNTLSAYQQYYVLNNFARDRVGFDSFKVLSRTATRYFLPINNMYQHWLWGAAVTGLSDQRLPRGQLAVLAMQQGFNLLRDTLATPRHGTHVYDETRREYFPRSGKCPEIPDEVLVPLADGGFVPMPGCISVPRGEGRSYFSRFDVGSYDGFDRTLEVGHFYDQMAALTALSNASAQIVGVGSDVAADTRRYRIPYNLVFGRELSTLLSAVYAGDDEAYAHHVLPLADGSAVVVPDGAALPEVPPELMRVLPLIAPGRSKTAQVQALVAGMNMLDSSLNPTFAQRGQIALVGGADDRDAPQGFERVDVENPLTGRAFVAYRRIDGEEGPWYAAELLEQARAIVEAPELDRVAVESVFGDVELMRLASSIFSD